MRITALEKRRHRVRVHVEGEDAPRSELALDVVVRAGLAVGDALSPDRLAALEAEDERVRAREAALRLLSQRPRSRAELRRRLGRKAFAASVIARTMGWLDERGYVDDAAFAEAFVRDRLRLRPRGRVGLLQELRRKGVDDTTSAAAIDRVMASEQVDETTMAREAAEAWARRNPAARRGDGRDARARSRRRLYGHLARRGFSPDAVRAALRAVLRD